MVVLSKIAFSRHLLGSPQKLSCEDHVDPPLGRRVCGGLRECRPKTPWKLFLNAVDRVVVLNFIFGTLLHAAQGFVNRRGQETLGLVKRPRDLSPTVYFNPLFSSTVPSTFVTFIDFDTSSPVLGFFQPQSKCHSSCLSSMLTCHSSRRSGPTSITVFWILSESLPAVGYPLFMPAIGYALFTSCGSALLASFHQDHSSVRIHPVCCFELCLLSGVAVCECVNLVPRAPYTHRLSQCGALVCQGLAVVRRAVCPSTC